MHKFGTLVNFGIKKKLKIITIRNKVHILMLVSVNNAIIWLNYGVIFICFSESQVVMNEINRINLDTSIKSKNRYAYLLTLILTIVILKCLLISGREL